MYIYYKNLSYLKEKSIIRMEEEREETCLSNSFHFVIVKAMWVKKL